MMFARKDAETDLGASASHLRGERFDVIEHSEACVSRALGWIALSRLICRRSIALLF